MYAVSFERDGLAHTLNADELCENHDGEKSGYFTRTHADGWTISGVVREDWYFWVNDFEAHHPTFGRVWGNFEETVSADSREGYEAFLTSHGPEHWDLPRHLIAPGRQLRRASHPFISRSYERLFFMRIQSRTPVVAACFCRYTSKVS